MRNNFGSHGSFARAAAAVFLMLLLWGALSSLAHAFATGRVVVETGSGNHSFEVEIAATAEERQTGLMFRRFLEDGTGMLFDFGGDQTITMWMKNTYVPLDMIFIDSSGTIVGIERNTEPLSLEVISSGSPARAVLEVLAGTADRLGISPGDRVIHEIFEGP